MSKVSIITAGEAAALVGDSMTVTTSGFVASDIPFSMRLPRETWTAAEQTTLRTRE